MTTLMPQKPGHWTEAVLLAFPDAVLTHDYPEAEVMHVTLSLAEDWEIEFRRDEFTLEDAPESFTANIQSYGPDHGLVEEEMLFESSDIDVLNDAVREWVEMYFEAQAEIDQALSEFGTTEESQ